MDAITIVLDPVSAHVATIGLEASIAMKTMADITT